MRFISRCCWKKGLADDATWETAKTALKRYLGEEDPKREAWRKLQKFKAMGKSLGAIATEVESLSKLVTTDNEVQERMAVEAFLGAIPWKIAKQIRRKKVEKIKEALSEARFLSSLLEEEEEREREEKLKQAEALVSEKERSTIPRDESPRTPQNYARKPSRTPQRRRRREIRCWGCQQPGHILKDCDSWNKFQGIQQAEVQQEFTQLNSNGDH